MTEDSKHHPLREAGLIFSSVTAPVPAELCVPCHEITQVCTNNRLKTDDDNDGDIATARTSRTARDIVLSGAAGFPICELLILDSFKSVLSGGLAGGISGLDDYTHLVIDVKSRSRRRNMDAIAKPSFRLYYKATVNAVSLSGHGEV